MIRFTARGQLYSMKNSKTVKRLGRRLVPVKHDKALIFERDFLYQVPVEAKRNITGPVAVTVRVWYPSRLQDLDCALVYDLLQKAGVIQNDRQVVEKHEFIAGIDPQDPRVTVEISER